MLDLSPISAFALHGPCPAWPIPCTGTVESSFAIQYIHSFRLNSSDTRWSGWGTDQVTVQPVMGRRCIAVGLQL